MRQCMNMMNDSGKEDYVEYKGKILGRENYVQ